MLAAPKSDEGGLSYLSLSPLAFSLFILYYTGMDNLQQLWDNKPGAVILLILGFIVFLFLVVDAWRHKRRNKRPK